MDQITTMPSVHNYLIVQVSCKNSIEKLSIELKAILDKIGNEIRKETDIKPRVVLWSFFIFKPVSY